APVRDRLKDLLALGTLNGIDFVEILDATETNLKVHFLTGLSIQSSVTSVSITGGETIPTVDVLPGAWVLENGKWTLALSVAARGGFSTHALTIKSPVMEEYFDRVPFSFKALCPSDIDCEQPAEPCPTDDVDVPPIDYLAKDFQSFRRALSDFSALRYPAW